ncbi:hypothetical protein [Tautonia marina]|uniref:hypothetical protein n=1 Tax=Tautonia marina TaxID=2653855 RepID=UPI0013759CCD|nr:hypothetical protein [Tautonia marina]
MLDRRWQIISATIASAAYWLQRQGVLVRTTLDGRPAWAVRYVRRGVGDRRSPI